MREKIVEVGLTFDELMEIIDSNEDSRNSLYELVKQKADYGGNGEMTDFIDSIAKKGYSDGIENVELKDGKIIATYWASED